MSSAFPLSAIVGQEALIEALLVNAVAPTVGGVLIRGERGTAKSTAVRGLAPLLPPVTAAACQQLAFAPGERAPDGTVPVDAEVTLRAAPLVELPLGTTLDRLVGSLDLSRALAGEHAFEPGLLARAHQGIVYVDEVNLLPDHLVDALLDVAAGGLARVEREAVSVEHAARFMLVGTMNVEEGELRPQLLDRFGLGVEVTAPTDPAVRAEIVRRRLDYEQDPERFVERFQSAERALAERIARARQALGAVRLDERELLRIAAACARLGVDGVRGDIVSARTARALAALDGVEQVEEEHVRRAAWLALAHRRRRDPLDRQMPSRDDVERALDDGGDDGDDGDDRPPGGRSPGRRPQVGGRSGAGQQGSTSADGDATGISDVHGSQSQSDRDARRSAQSAAQPSGDAPTPARLATGALRLVGSGQGPSGRRARTAGPGVGAIDSRPVARHADDLALVATLHARLRGETSALRAHVRAGREGALICLVVDASGSMAAQRRLARVKGALIELLRDAYARRDRVAIVAFRDERAEILVAPGTSPERAAAVIAKLPAGGRTPLAAGLQLAGLLVNRERIRDRQRRSIVVLFSDGRVRDPDGTIIAAASALGRTADAVEVVDTEEGPVRVGLCAAIAQAAGGRIDRLATPPGTANRRRAA